MFLVFLWIVLKFEEFIFQNYNIAEVFTGGLSEYYIFYSFKCFLVAWWGAQFEIRSGLGDFFIDVSFNFIPNFCDV